jgi:hypothetical protein
VHRKEGGLTHVSPFSKILFAKFGPEGNYKQNRGYAPGIVEDLKDVEQSVCLHQH